MPIKRELYPNNWEEISLSVKIKAKWTCQHCGKPCRQPHLKLKDIEKWLNSHYREPI
jgi:hypothetical protein